jgi:hypothetical protein
LLLGINRLEKIIGKLKDGNIIPIYFEIYRSIIELGVTSKIGIKNLYNLIDGWMNIYTRLLTINIGSIGEYRVEMGAELDVNSFI